MRYGNLSGTLIAFAVLCCLVSFGTRASAADARIVLGGLADGFEMSLSQTPPAVVAPGETFVIKYRVAESKKYKLQAKSEYAGADFFIETADGKPHPIVKRIQVDEISFGETISEYEILYYVGAVEYAISLQLSDNATVGETLVFRIVPLFDICEKEGRGLCLRVSAPPHTMSTLFVPPVYEFSVRMDNSLKDRSTITTKPTSKEEVGSDNSPRSLWRAIGGFFLLGLFATLLPCTYPMIPFVVTRLAGSTPSTSISGTEPAAKRRVLSILLTWLSFLAGMTVVTVLLGALAGGASRLMGSVVVSVPFNALLAALFILFAFNMFGAFEISLPSSIQTKLQVKSAGRYASGFLMGIIAIFVSFSCSAALIAASMTILASSYPGRTMPAVLGMAAFGFGYALPYGALSLTAGALPRPGQWMLVLKKSMGIVMLLSSFWFLQIVLPEPWQLSLILSLTLMAIAVFVGGFDTLASDAGAFQRVKKAAGIVFFLFGLLFFYDFSVQAGFMPKAGAASTAVKTSGIQWRYSLDEARSESRTTGKPLFLDFRADNCSVCIKMERTVFLESSVIERLNRDYIPVKLDLTGKNKKDAAAAAEEYNVIGQPNFIYLSPDGKIIERWSGGYTTEELIDALTKLR